MLKVRFNNVNREHQIIEQPNIVQGSQDFISIVISFGTYSGGNFVPTLQYTESDDIQVGAIYTRPDGDKSWFIPFEKQIDGTFTSVLSDWVTRKSGVLNIDVQVKNIVTGTTNPFTRIKQTILEGTALNGDDWEFGEADYDAIISTQLSHGGRLIALEGRVETNKTDIQANTNDIIDLQTSKQDTLIAGENITIIDNVVSASGGGGSGSDLIPDEVTIIKNESNIIRVSENLTIDGGDL